MIAATNRDLAAELQSGGFREDLYYRICSDVIHVPTLPSGWPIRPTNCRIWCITLPST